MKRFRTVRSLGVALALSALAPCGSGGAEPPEAQAGEPWSGQAAVVTETCASLGAVPLAQVPVTFSRVGCAGDFTAGITPLVDGRPLPAQVDVLARNADESIRHALVTFVLPELGEGQALEVGYADGTAPEPPPFEWAEEGRGDDLVLELTGAEERRWSARLELPEGPPGIPIPGAVTLFDGPLMKEYEVHQVPTDEDGRPHPTLDVLFRLREFSGQRSMRVAVVVETTRLDGGSPRPRTKFAGLRLTRGDAELIARGPYEQLDRTRFRLLSWTDGPLESIHRRPDVAYLERGRFIPPYRPPEGGLDVAAAEKRYSPDRKLLRHLMPGVIHPHMPGTADRPDIGPYPGWALAYLYSGSPRLYRVLLHADGNGSGAFPVHLRRRPRVPGVMRGADKKQIEARSKLRLPQRRETESGAEPDQAHAPSLGYLSYILTGDRYYAEELSFWASYQLAQWPFEGLNLGAPERTQAWGLRHLVDAAFLLPDEHPLKDYFVREVNAYLERVTTVAEESGRELHFLRDQFRSSGRPHWVNCRRTSPWQYAWVVWSLGNAVDKGFERAELPRRWTAEYLVGLYTSEDEYVAPDGETYRFDPRDAMWSNLATSLHEYRTEMHNGQRRTQLGRKLENLDNYGAVWYWTKVNCDNGYNDRNGLRRAPDAKGAWPLNDPGWGHGRGSSERMAYNWHRYGAWSGLVSALNGQVEGSERAFEVMSALAGPGAQHGFNMQPRDRAGAPITAD